jgi:RNA polymerase sigma-70 factor (ECF subfamily)
MATAIDVGRPRPPEDLVRRAQDGDPTAYERLWADHRAAIHVHCYRMSGSVHDADDATQETFVRAWRALDRFEGRSSLSTWLHRIATNVCLTAAARRRDVPVAGDHEVPHLTPYPDRLLDRVAPAAFNPAARYAQRESVELAFVTAAQLLPPRQRAALVLCDVLAWPAAEVATLLETSEAAVNSALQRARAGLERHRAAGGGVAGVPDREAVSLARRWAEAWEAADVGTLAELLRDDVVATMPPESLHLVGRSRVVDFLAASPFSGTRRFRVSLTAANGQPAVALYLLDDQGPAYRAYIVQVLTVRNGGVASLVAFRRPDLFPRLGLPGRRDL